MDNPPEFKGGRDSLSSFIAANLSVEKLINCLVPNKKVYTDTARVKFIVGRNGVLSNLTIDLTANSIFHHELFGAIIKSSCFWKPGNFGRNVDGWLQFDIYYMLEKEEYQIVTKLGIGKM